MPAPTPSYPSSLWGELQRLGVPMYDPVSGQFWFGPGNALSIAPSLASGSTQAPVFAASQAVDLSLGLNVAIGPMTANMTFLSPTNVPAAGSIVSYEFTQDGTGTRTITWSALHKGAFVTTAGTGGQKKRVTARSDGTNLIFVSDSGWYTP